MKKTIIAFMALATIILASCGNPMMTTSEDLEPTIELQIVGVPEKVIVGETFTLSIEEVSSRAISSTITWTSSNSEIATVEDGVVTTLSDGTVKIQASNGDKTASIEITIEPSVEPEPIPEPEPVIMYTITFDSSAWENGGIVQVQYKAGDTIIYPDFSEYSFISDDEDSTTYQAGGWSLNSDITSNTIEDIPPEEMPSNNFTVYVRI